MTECEFDELIDDVIDQVNDVVVGKNKGAVNIALAELLFMDIDSMEEFREVVDMLNEIAQSVSEDGFEEVGRVH